MPDFCVNKLKVSASTEGAKVELKDFIQKCGSTSKIFSLEPAFPVPTALRINQSTPMIYGLAIIKARDGDDTFLKSILEFPWSKEQGITNLADLEEYLVRTNKADVVLGHKAYLNIKNYGVADADEWRDRNWGVKWDASDSDILVKKDCGFEVRFLTPWEPPLNWMIKVSRDYPGLHFCDKYTDIEDTKIILEGQNGLFTENGEPVPEQSNVDNYDLWDYLSSTLLTNK